MISRKIWVCTVWKFHYFTAYHFLRESKLADFKSLKRLWIFIFGKSSYLNWKLKNSQYIKMLVCSKLLFFETLMSPKNWFHVKSEGQKISKIPTLWSVNSWPKTISFSRKMCNSIPIFQIESWKQIWEIVLHFNVLLYEMKVYNF